jgi:hypothetical protein
MGGHARAGPSMTNSFRDPERLFGSALPFKSTIAPSRTTSAHYAKLDSTWKI